MVTVMQKQVTIGAMKIKFRALKGGILKTKIN